MRPDPDWIEASRPNDIEITLLAAEVRRLQAVIASGEPTLTDAEREAVEQAARLCQIEGKKCAAWPENAWAATLRGLLERTKV